MNQSAKYYGVGVESFNQRPIDILEWACILWFRNISIFPALTLFSRGARERQSPRDSRWVRERKMPFYVLNVHINSLARVHAPRFRIQYEIAVDRRARLRSTFGTATVFYTHRGDSIWAFLLFFLFAILNTHSTVICSVHGGNRCNK